jgi:hypothetical protein
MGLAEHPKPLKCLDFRKDEVIQRMTEEGSLPVNRPFNKKVFLFIVVLLIPAAYAVLPFSFTVASITLEPGEWPLIAVATLVNVAIYSVLAAVGLYLAGRIGLGLPFVEGWLKKEPTQDRFRRAVATSAGVGIGVGVVIIVLSAVVFDPPLQAETERLGITIPESIHPPPWQGALASFSAGVTEEVIFRLFGVTLLAWLGSLLFHDSEGRPKLAVLWIANILIAVVFGLAHLPQIVLLTDLPLSPLVITRTVVLNSIGGAAFGWLYWKQGLESSMVAHFSADIVLHVILVMLTSQL